MSDVEYILGTGEYLMLEIENETPGETFAPASWTAAVYLAEVGHSVVIHDLTAGDWETASIETVGTKYYAKVNVDDVVTDVGAYRAYIQLTKTLGTENPVLLRGEGTVTIVGE